MDGVIAGDVLIRDEAPWRTAQQIPNVRSASV